MPVCLNCGSEIPAGRKYCDSCSADGELRVRELMAMAGDADRRMYRGSGRRGLFIAMLIVFLVLLGLGVGLVYSIPTGPAFEKKAQAAVCRSQQRAVRNAISRYYGVFSKYPPTGRLTNSNPLVEDQYLEKAPRCPSTHRYYVLRRENDTVVVTCDSGLEGHEIEASPDK